MKKIRKIKRAESPLSLRKPEDYSLREQGITQSLLSTYLQCRQKFLLRLNKYTHSSGNKRSFFGNITHEVLAQCYLSIPVPKKADIRNYVDVYLSSNSDILVGIDEQQIEYDRAVCEIVLEKYIKLYKKDFKEMKFSNVEDEFAVDFFETKLRGKIDGRFIIADKVWLMEHKTKGRISEDSLMKRLTFDSQNLFYILGDELQRKEPVRGVLYNIIRNPQIRPKKGESLKNFSIRLTDDIDKRPEFYFMRFEIPYTSIDKERFKDQLREILDEMQEYLDNDCIPIRNAYACDMPWECEYLDACTGNCLTGYTKKEFLFSELKEYKY